MDCIVHGVTKSRTQLSDFHFSHKEAVGPVDPPVIPKAPPLMPSGDYPPLLQHKSVNLFLEEGKTQISGSGEARHSCGQKSYTKKTSKLIYAYSIY